MRILVFGSYDKTRHPRIEVVAQGLRAAGDSVTEVNAPLNFSTSRRVELLRKPWKLPSGMIRVARSWWELYRRSRAQPVPDAVVVGYLGQIDIHLARLLWPQVPIVLDFLVSLADTARDRRLGTTVIEKSLEWLDRAAVDAADVVAVDTDENRGQVPESGENRTVVVPVGAPDEWFRSEVPPVEGERLRVVFFGLYTPLQGTPVIGEAIRALEGEPVDFLMIGTGQDYEETRQLAGGSRSATWVSWADPKDLRELVAGHHVCLGIFGDRPKSYRVVPNKVYQGAASGCAIVTSDTPPQRRALGDAGIFVPPGDSQAVARTLERLHRDPGYRERMRRVAHERAQRAFRPQHVVSPLRDRLRELT